MILDVNLCPPLHPKCDHWATIFTKKALKGGVLPMRGTLLKPTWARPAAQNAQGYVFIDSGVGFGVILGSSLKQFGLDFGAIWATIKSSLIGIPKTLLVEVFPRTFCMFHADFWYSVQAFWYSIKAELSRQASRYSTKASWYSTSPTDPISPTYPMYPTYLTYPTYLDLSNLSNVSNKSNVSNLSNLSNWSNLSNI